MLGYTVSRLAGLQERQARTNSIEVWIPLRFASRECLLAWRLIPTCTCVL